MADTTSAKNFESRYRALNPAQREAVDTINGPVMVVAGPGTGKTQILTLRIANILQKTDTPPDGILALTFTEAGVDAMKQRLLKLIGPTAYKVGIYTFHSFCNDVIHAHPEHFPRIISATALTEIESIMVIREALSSLPLERLKPFGDPYFYVQSVRSAIQTLKREHRAPQDVIESTEMQLKKIEADPESRHEKGAHKGKVKGEVQTRIDRLTKERELGTVFAWYEEKLAQLRKFDFEDMIGEVVRALEDDESLLLTIQEQYLYILADEHQDANGAQNRLLELLASYDASPNVFIVGDEKQAIFRFQGATLDSFDHFKKIFPTARLIRLTDSYRSGTKLLDAAHGLMHTVIPEERHPRLVSKLEHPELAALELRTFSSEEVELQWVVEEIRSRIAEGVAPGDIAIMYRTNADALPISRLLAHKGILHTLDSRGSVFSEHAVAQFVTYLRLCTQIGHDEYAAHVLHFPWVAIPPHDSYRIMLHAQKIRRPIAEVLASYEALSAARVRDIRAAQDLGQVLERLAQSAREDSARDFFDRVLHESGFLTHALSRSDAVTVLNAIRGLARTLEELSASKTLYTGRDFITDLALYEEYGIEIRPDVQPKERTNAVHLVTAHGSKGLEYEYVYIVHARDKHWGNRIERSNLPLSTLSARAGSDVDDERRLFYVALTRAKQYVSVSYGVTAAQRERESSITQFMLEIDSALVQTCETAAFEDSIKPEQSFALRPAAPSAISDHLFLRDAFLEQGLSATALNNYLDCPWKYFYRNLIRVPEKPTASSLYGNALHQALRHYRELCASTNTVQPLDQLLEFLHVAIDAQGFTPTSYEDAKEKGVRALTQWHERNAESLSFRTLCEKKFEVYLPVTHEMQQVLLRGLVDVIEFGSDDATHVIDYKTGKHRSRNEIEGKTKNATGDYKRQLDFYCILLELSKMDAPRALSIEFIEPDQKGKTVVHDFEYDSAAVAELKTVIDRASREIYELAFWDRTCDTPECEYCALRALMK